MMVVDPLNVEVADTVGAGDSMVAGLAWGLSQSWPMEQILRLASAVSALAVTQIGVGIADPQQLATLMAVFRNENLVDFSGSRDRFYGAPRRSHREKS